MQKNDPVVVEIYNAVLSGTPAPAQDMLSARSAEVKNLYAQLGCLRISEHDVLYREYYNSSTSQTYRQTVVPLALRRQISDDLHRGLNGATWDTAEPRSCCRSDSFGRAGLSM